MRTKNKMKNYLKLGILFFAVLFFTSCEPEEYIESSKEQQNEVTIKKISLKDFTSKKALSKDLKTLSSKFEINKMIQKNVTATDGSFTILTNEILEASNDSITTYTFRIETPTDSTSAFENFIIKQKNDSLKYIIFKYKYDETYPDFFPYRVSSQIVNNTQISSENFDDYLKDYYYEIQDDGCLYLFESYTINDDPEVKWRFTRLYCGHTEFDNTIDQGDSGYGSGDTNTNYGNSGDLGDAETESNEYIFPPQPFNVSERTIYVALPPKVDYFGSFLKNNNFSVGTPERNWLEAHLFTETRDLLAFLKLNDESHEANSYVLAALNELMNGNVSTFKDYIKNTIETPLSTMATAEDFDFRIDLIKFIINTFSSDFTHLSDLLDEIKNTTNTTIENLVFIEERLMAVYNILKPHAAQLIISGDDGLASVLNAVEFKEVKLNLTAISIFPFFNSLGEHIPRTAEEWMAIAKIMGQFLVEIGLALIPGSDIIGVVNGLNDGDIVAITLGIAGLAVDAFGGVILKAIGKIGKVMYKTFKIFRIATDYLGVLVRFIAQGFKTKLLGGAVRIIDNIGTAVAEIQGRVMRFITNAAIDIIKVGDLKLLDAVSPTGLGSISAGKINSKAMRILPENPKFADDIADIVQNGDLRGIKTEEIMQKFLEQDGYTAIRDVHLPGNKGFDNVFIKKNTNGEITDIIINESKQISNTGSISMSSGVVGSNGSACTGCTQMSEDWIDDVIKRMQIQGGDVANLANDIENFGISNITQLVSGVNKNTRELVIVNITGFNPQ